MKTIDKLTSNDFLYCYDPNLSRFLKVKGISYFHKARSVKDNAIYTMYIHSDDLRAAVKEWNTNH